MRKGHPSLEAVNPIGSGDAVTAGLAAIGAPLVGLVAVGISGGLISKRIRNNPSYSARSGAVFGFGLLGVAISAGSPAELRVVGMRASWSMPI